MWELQVRFHLGQIEDNNAGDSTSDTSEKLLQRGRGRSIYLGFWWKESTCTKALFFFFFYRFLLVTRSSHHHEGFWCFSRYEEIQELGSWNQILKISNHLKTCPASFSQSTECLISALTSWTPFRRYWKSAAAAVNYLVCVKIDGKCQAVVDSTNLTELLPRLNELKYMKCLAHSRYSINICCYLSWISTMKVLPQPFCLYCSVYWKWQYFSGIEVDRGNQYITAQ